MKFHRAWSAWASSTVVACGLSAIALAQTRPVKDQMWVIPGAADQVAINGKVVFGFPVVNMTNTVVTDIVVRYDLFHRNTFDMDATLSEPPDPTNKNKPAQVGEIKIKSIQPNFSKCVLIVIPDSFVRERGGVRIGAISGKKNRVPFTESFRAFRPKDIQASMKP
jgi:hypothetical protein